MPTNPKVTSKKTATVSPKKSSQVLATSKMVLETRAELKSDIATLRVELRGEFKKIRTEMSEINIEILELRKQISEQTSMFHRMMALMEEQAARNIFVLDGYTSLEARLTALES